jgi:hypothetical protein
LNIGLYIPPELFSLNLKPLELLIAAEILQFGDGKCHARASHFSKRFGRPKRTVLDAIERLRESQIIVEDGQVKRLAVAATNRAENDTNDTEIRATVDKSARAEKRINCAENDIDRAENAHKCAENDTRSKVRNKQETKLERSKNARGAGAEGFAEFYDLYPRKVGKANAEKSWTKLAPSPDLRQQIAAHVAAMSQTWDWQKDGGQFVPHPATYLNQKRWTDELPKGNGAVAMRAPQQSALPLNAPSTVEPPAPTSTLPAGLTKSAGDLAWWAGCLGKIADGMDPDFFREYIGCLEIAGIDGEWLHLEAPTAYIKGNAVWHCDAIEEATGKQVKIHVRDWSQDE